jgi:hypothetical protein
MNSYRHRAQRRFPLWSWYNFFALHFGQAIFAIFNSVNHSLIWVLKKQFTLFKNIICLIQYLTSAAIISSAGE